MRAFLGVYLIVVAIGVLTTLVALAHPAPWPRVWRLRPAWFVERLVFRLVFAIWAAVLLFS